MSQLFRPRVLRWSALVAVPAAIFLIVALGRVEVTSNGHHHSLSEATLNTARGVIAFVALMIASPLAAWLVRQLLKAIVITAVALWFLFSLAVTGGDYLHFWPPIVKPGTNFLLQNIAYLTSIVGVLLLIIVALAVIFGRKNELPPVDPNKPVLTTEEIQREAAATWRANYANFIRNWNFRQQ